MLKQHAKILSATAPIVDAFTLTGAFFLSFPVRHLVLKWVPYGGRINFSGLYRLVVFVSFHMVDISTLAGSLRSPAVDGL